MLVLSVLVLVRTSITIGASINKVPEPKVSPTRRLEMTFMGDTYPNTGHLRFATAKAAIFYYRVNVSIA